MQTVEQALERILQTMACLSAEHAALSACVGRVLAEDIYADIPQPAFDNSAVDGYAVRAQDTRGASAERPVPLACIGDIPAGVWPELEITPGVCARILTGAPVPMKADAIVMVEDTAPLDGGRVAMREAARPGQHIRHMGEDVETGDLVLAVGTRLRAAQIGLLAQMGRARVSVVRLPRVAVISTGDEVVEIQQGAIPPPGKIRNSNSYALAALVQETGAILHSRLHLPDDLAATQAALRRCAGLPQTIPVSTNLGCDFGLRNTPQEQQAGQANKQKVDQEADQDVNAQESSAIGRNTAGGGTGKPNVINEADGGGAADVIITAGGVSVGERDFVKAALESLGTLDLWRVAMKPGKPLAFGRIGNTLFFGLPGNPVSAQVTFELFVRPALLKMAGWREEDTRRRQVEAMLTEAITHVPGRREYLRGVTEWRNGNWIARPIGGQSSADARSFALANSLLIVPEEATTLAAGQALSVLLLN